MEIKSVSTQHLVKSEDLNHHGTLFAGRTAEWFVEAGLIATAAFIPPENIVCVKIHGMAFTMPVKLGEIVTFSGKVVLTGKTRLVTNVRVSVHNKEVVNGFITFVNVDHDGHPFPHGVEIEPASPEDIALQELAKKL